MVSTAAQFDAKLTAKSSATKNASNRYTINKHDVTHKAIEIDDEVFYEIDFDLDTFQANNSTSKHKFLTILDLPVTNGIAYLLKHRPIGISSLQPKKHYLRGTV